MKPKASNRVTHVVRRFLPFLAALSLGLSVGGCATNPVTGKSELNLVGEGQELAIGQKNYGPYRQAQGGDYVLEPGLTRYVQGIGDRLAKVSDRKLPYEFNILNDSTPNAWALPGGKIAVNRGLLVELESEAELAAVLGHEIVHAAARHGAQGMERGILLQGAILATGIALSDSDYRGVALAGAGLTAGLVNKRYGRDAEREADYYGMRYMARAGYDPQAAVALQKTFVRLADGHSPGWLDGLFASHPPSQERVDNNKRTVAELKVKKGKIGRETYQRMIARIKKNKPAYEAHDKGRAALKKGELGKALKLANQAIKIEPKEALFHQLRGDIREAQGRDKDALTNYDRAVALNSSYYQPYLARGQLRRDMGDMRGAESDLRRSKRLFPSADAELGLGELALAAGDQNAAKQHFSAAAATEGAVGRQARDRLARLDLADNPSRYIATRLGLDGQGMLMIELVNQTNSKVRVVSVLVGQDGGGRLVNTKRVSIKRNLDPGERVVWRAGIGPLNKNQLQPLRAVVDQARLVK